MKTASTEVNTLAEPSDSLPAGIIDCCINTRWADPLELHAHLASGWREFIGYPGRLAPGRGMASLLPKPPLEHPRGGWLTNSDGSMPGSNPEEVAASYLDPCGIAKAVVCPLQALAIGGVPNTSYAIDVARAVNDWTIEHWLDRSPRYGGLIAAATQVPALAAEEIRRAASHPGMVGVLLAGNGLSQTFGHPAYDPIHAVAAELELPIVIHTESDFPPSTTSHPTAGGFPDTFTAYYALRAQSVVTHLLSIVVQGVLERYRGLKFLIAGAGITWLPPFLWRLDTDFKAYAARETPWLQRHPEQQLREQVRVTTHALGGTPKDGGFRDLISTLDWLADVLCYASGHPLWDADSTDTASKRFPERWWPRIFRDNAAALYRWDDNAERKVG